MKHLFVPYELALKLKEKGFDKPCLMGYNLSGYLRSKIAMTAKDVVISWDKHDENIPAPLWQQVIDWLREKHNTHVQITVEFYQDGINYLWQVLIYNPKDPTAYDERSTGLYGDNHEYPTYESALEEGIRRALELI